MAESATTARPYARAAFARAKGTSQLAEWSSFLTRASQAVQNPQVEPLIGNPRVESAKLVDFLQELGGGNQPEQRNFLQLLADNRRLLLLPEITAQFEQLRADAEHVAHVEVRSAQPLTADESSRLKSALQKRLGSSVELHAEVDRSLLAGAIVRCGDLVIDGSLRARIERMASAMASA